MHYLFFAAFLLVSFLASSQPAPAPSYIISQVPLPGEMDKQVCISGLNYFQGNLLFASERCPFVISANPLSGKISHKINSGVQYEFEMEGLTSYHNKLYLVSENLVAIYELDPLSQTSRTIPTSISLPPKSKSGDGMEGIAANENHDRFYLLRERNENMTSAEIFSFRVISEGTGIAKLEYENKIELPLQNADWRYSDICYDKLNNQLLCLKSYSKGKTRQQFIETINIDEKGNLLTATLKSLAVENFSSISNQFKDQRYSMNLEGIAIDETGNIYVVSDNTSGKADCDRPSKEKTILLKITKK